MTTPPPTPALLRRAAELRAVGNAWEKVADDVGRPLAAVRAWPQRYPTRWAKALDAAERQVLAECTAEAVLMLRKQLRSEDEKSVREAAHKLVQIRVALERSARPTDPDRSDPPPGRADRLVRFLRGLTRDDVDHLKRLESAHPD